MTWPPRGDFDAWACRLPEGVATPSRPEELPERAVAWMTNRRDEELEACVDFALGFNEDEIKRGARARLWCVVVRRLTVAQSGATILRDKMIPLELPKP